MNCEGVDCWKGVGWCRDSMIEMIYGRMTGRMRKFRKWSTLYF